MAKLSFLLLGAMIMLGLIWLRTAYATFRAQKPQDYAETGPIFDIREHLNGTIDCDGVIYGPTGRVTSRFTGVFHAEWDGNTGQMSEHFVYDNGNTQDRFWTLKVDDQGRITATAPDVVGTGTGWQSGAAVQLRYKIQLPEQAGGHVLDTVDWMYRSANGTITNRSELSKFGIKVAELVATMRPRAAGSQEQLAAE